jgi:hypothetical protein
VSAGADDRALVVGELRGFRQFFLVDGRLHPVVHGASGPWDGQLERARCVHVPEHVAPVGGCTCGLYAMYRPGSATVSLGAANAVVAARGRCVLGDRGFRAAAARVEAVALPSTLLLQPRLAARVRRALAEHYPGARVYRSTRRMLRDHPAQDVSALGVVPPPDRSRELRAAAVLVWGVFVLAGYSVLFLPEDAVSELARTWWPALVAAVLAWQAALVWLLCRLMALQMPDTRDRRGE